MKMTEEAKANRILQKMHNKGISYLTAKKEIELEDELEEHKARVKEELFEDYLWRHDFDN